MHVRHGRLVVVRALVPTAYVLACTHTRGVVHVGALSFVIIIIIIIYHLFDYKRNTTVGSQLLTTRPSSMMVRR